MSLDTITHKNILIKILKDIYVHPIIGPILGFKGGTAAYLFYDLDRFSVDLDFDLLEASKEDIIFEEVKKILDKYGTVKTAQKKRFNLIYILSYKNKKVGAQNVKVEINRRDFDSKYDVKAHLGISMKVMIKEDMAAHKLVAMYERIGKTNRDIYDAWFFLQNNWPINKKIVEERTGLSFKKYLQTCLNLLNKFDNQTILAGIGELLTASQKNWVRTKLKTEIIFLFKLMLDNEKHEKHSE